MLYYSWLNRIIIPRNIYISPFHQFPGQHSGKQRPLTVCRHIWKNQYHWEVDRDTSRLSRTRQLWRGKQRQRTSKSSWKMKNNSWKSLCERHGEIFMYSEENRSRKVTSPNLESEFFFVFFYRIKLFDISRLFWQIYERIFRTTWVFLNLTSYVRGFNLF